MCSAHDVIRRHACSFSKMLGLHHCATDGACRLSCMTNKLLGFFPGKDVVCCGWCDGRHEDAAVGTPRAPWGPRAGFVESEQNVYTAIINAPILTRRFNATIDTLRAALLYAALCRFCTTRIHCSRRPPSPVPTGHVPLARR